VQNNRLKGICVVTGEMKAAAPNVTLLNFAQLDVSLGGSMQKKILTVSLNEVLSGRRRGFEMGEG